MIRALYSAATGMQAQQKNLEVIANNLANVNTTGFKRSRAEFQDLLYQSEKPPGADQGNGNLSPSGVQIGHGSRLVSTTKLFTTGELTNTGDKYNVAITGDGFFEVNLPDGTRAFTRDGALKLDSTGNWVTTDGGRLGSGFQAVPPGTTEINITTDGRVSLKGPGVEQNFNVQLFRFANPAGLVPLGGNLYREGLASGQAEVGDPNANGFGGLAQGFLEMSNVKVVDEMVNMIVAQRAYEVNSKAVQSADEMMGIANSLRR
jgi:flagellar basal-body rod protein FlgG